MNTTLKLKWGGQWFVLRFYTRDPKLGQIEQAVYERIQGLVQVPELIGASTEESAYAYALFRFCASPSTLKAKPNDAAALSEDLGRALARIHSIAFSQAGLFAAALSMETVFPEGSRPYVEHCLEQLHPQSLAWKRLGEEPAQEVRGFLENHAELSPQIDGGGCLVHADFKPVNLLWDAERGLTVLDWEFAHSGHPLMDLGILLRHFRDFPLSLPDLEQSYRRHGGTLPTGWIQKARLTDLVNVIQLLNTPGERSELMRSLIESLEMTMDFWDWLEDLILKKESGPWMISPRSYGQNQAISIPTPCRFG